MLFGLVGVVAPIDVHDFLLLFLLVIKKNGEQIF
jgi:hypothetical protein